MADLRERITAELENIDTVVREIEELIASKKILISMQLIHTRCIFITSITVLKIY